MGQAVGFIETIGLAAAMEAADAAVKSANVRMVGYELTRGGGMVTVKVQGDVGAVKSAIDAAKTASSKVNQVYAVHVIPRPAAFTGAVIRTAETVLREDVASDAARSADAPGAPEEISQPPDARLDAGFAQGGDAPEVDSHAESPEIDDHAEAPDGENVPPDADGEDAQDLDDAQDSEDTQDSDEPATPDGQPGGGNGPQTRGGPRRKRRRG
jgi:microcompartment protein CcmL/EutN